jgi:hypothetical protein
VLGQHRLLALELRRLHPVMSDFEMRRLVDWIGLPRWQ